MEFSSFTHTREHIVKAREKGFARLKFNPDLEKDFSKYFSRLTQSSFTNSYWFMLVPFFLIAHLNVMGISINEFFSTLLQAIKSIFKLSPILQGTIGLYNVQLFAFLIVLILWPLRNHALFENHFQMKLSISTAVTVSIMSLSLFMIDDHRYMFSVQMELVATLLFVFVLLHFQVVYLLLNQTIVFILLSLFVLVFDLQTDWSEFSALFSSMFLFGFIFAYLREIRERDNFLQILEIENQRQEYEFLHHKIEKENLIKEKLSALHSAMSGEKNLQPLAEKILGYIVPILDCSLASLYLCKDQELILLANYGTSEKSRERLNLGETLVGQAAVSKKVIKLDESPEEFQIIRSGLGSIQKPAIYIMPILFADELVAVIELASIKKISDHHIELLESASRSIGTALRAVAAKSTL